MLTSIWQKIPEPARRSVRRAVARPIFADQGSEETFWSAFHTPAGHVLDEVGVALRALGGRSLYIRPGTSDPIVLLEAFIGRFHLPPGVVRRTRPRLIWDLGANIGVTTAHLAALFPDARLVAVEPNPESVDLARRNLHPWRDRCELVNAAIWHEDGHVILDRSNREYESKVSPTGQGSRVVAVSPASLIAKNRGAVDYAKVDIEGAEREILRRAEDWASGVSCLKVEVHEPYTMDDARVDLRRAGYNVRRALSRSHTMVARR